jgi:hypothetical protein
LIHGICASVIGNTFLNVGVRNTISVKGTINTGEYNTSAVKLCNKKENTTKTLQIYNPTSGDA